MILEQKSLFLYISIEGEHKMQLRWCVLLMVQMLASQALYPLNSLPDSLHFCDTFNDKELRIDPRGIDGWSFFTGDGEATMTFSSSGKGYASIDVDGTHDQRGIWWALIKRCVSKTMNLELIPKPEYEFRIEARIRVSDAPKRVNLHLNTQRTTDFHSQLMEFDIPDTTQWHTISMTTKDFDAQPGDTVYGQLALMDWGFEKYRVDIDYFCVSIVNVDSIGKDAGVQAPYHPPIPSIDSLSVHLPVFQDAMVDTFYKNVNFYDWYDSGDTLIPGVLTIGGSEIVLLRWDFQSYKGKKAAGVGVLEITTHSIQRLASLRKDFGMLRVSEIIGGDEEWMSDSVTFSSFTKGAPLPRVVNSQMIIDVDANEKKYGKTLITISEPVLQRLLDGKSKGIAIKALGAIHGTFYSSRSCTTGTILHFSVK